MSLYSIQSAKCLTAIVTLVGAIAQNRVIVNLCATHYFYLKCRLNPYLSLVMARLKAFINGCVCFQGRQIEATVYIDQDSGLITSQPAEMPTDFVDLKGGILAPAYIDLQTNGCLGFHFTDFDTAESYSKNLARVSRHLVSRGVGAFYVTLPTVHRDMFQKVQYRSFKLHLYMQVYGFLWECSIYQSCQTDHDLAFKILQKI